MTKAKKRKFDKKSSKPASHTHKIQAHVKPPKPKGPLKQRQDDQPTIPFSPDDRILLVGDGDLSFSHSLLYHFDCKNVLSTVLEKDKEELVTKYPHSEQILSEIEQKGGIIRLGVDVRNMKKLGFGGKGSVNRRAGEGDVTQGPVIAKVEGKSNDGENVSEAQNELQMPDESASSNNNNDDDDDGHKDIVESDTRKGDGMDRIIFNFPHVGGKSTDVNRQVRYNQELLVTFFKRSLLSLATNGSIIVTLFEGEPYTLWNIRDLARHSGLQVERSFKFHASAYPGYHHARTLGIVKSKSGDAGGGWKGENRAARSYVFVRKGEATGLETQRTKRKRDVLEDSESDGD